jgi:hypothetical protein
LTRNRAFICSLAFLAGTGAPSTCAADDAASTAADVSFVSSVRPILEARCFRCHAGKAPKAELDLARFAGGDEVTSAFRLWDMVIRKVETGEMPPEGAKPMTDRDRRKLADWHRKTFLDLKPRPGRNRLRRLSRTEYRNTLSDLLGIPLRPSPLKSFYNMEAGSIVEKRLPPDPPGPSGFDNDASVLSLDDAGMARFVQIAEFLIEQLDSFPERRQALFAAGSAPEAAPARERARLILERFAGRAFRRPVTGVELAPFLGVFEASYSGPGRPGVGSATDAPREMGTSVLKNPAFVDAVDAAFTAILISPRFLYRLETVRGSRQPYRISDHELATRLSYFLWSTMPDDELFRLAAAGRLHESDVLDRQVARMLADPRSLALAENFGGQWLGYAALDRPDRFRVSRSEEQIKLLRSMYREPLLFFDDLVRSDRSLLELIDSRHTFLNPTLGYHYGMKGYAKPRLIKNGGYDWDDPLRRLPVEDPNRGGVLGMAATLLLTSAPERTSPVRRGVWILDALLGQRPPEPPPNAPPLKDGQPGHRPASMREQMARHRAEASCARCHDAIDPLGLALENFGPHGEWRGRDESGPIDATSVLPGGERVRGPAELKSTLLSNYREPFLRNACERLLSYAMGRAIQYTDRPTIDRLLVDLEAHDDRFSILVKGIVASVPFGHRED